MTRLMRLAVLTLALTLGSGTLAFAQDSLLQDLYGRGVHAFFARSFTDAHRDFTNAIDQGSRDPRCFYFRGLTYNRLGRPQEARADFQKGAELEASAGDQYYDVANALQRIQGSERIALEDTRRAARLAVRQRTEDVKKARYQEFTQGQPEVIRGGVPQKGAPPTRMMAKPSKLPAAPAPSDTTGEDLFDTPPKKPAAGVAAAPADDATMPAEKPATAPTAEDPFGDDAPKKTAKPAAAATAEADPFGGDGEVKPKAPATKPAADDPFGEADDKPKMKPEKPAAPAADDPFGDGDDKPKMKKEKATDPFADDPEKPEMKKDDGEMKNDGEMKKDAKKNDDPFG